MAPTSPVEDGCCGIWIQSAPVEASTAAPRRTRSFRAARARRAPVAVLFAAVRAWEDGINRREGNIISIEHLNARCQLRTRGRYRKTGGLATQGLHAHLGIPHRLKVQGDKDGEINPEQLAAGTTIIEPPRTLRFQEGFSGPGSSRGGDIPSGRSPEVQVPATPDSALPEPETVGVQRPRLGEVLVGLELLTRPQLEVAIGRQEKEGRLFGQTVLRLSLTSKMGLSRALAVQSGAPQSLAGRGHPGRGYSQVPAELAARLDVLPLTLADNGNALVVAMGTSRAQRVIRSEIRALVGMPVLPCVGNTAAIHRLVRDVYGMEEPSVCATAWSVQPVSRAPFESAWREAFEECPAQEM